MTLQKYFTIILILNFQGELSDILATTATLISGEVGWLKSPVSPSTVMAYTKAMGLAHEPAFVKQLCGVASQVGDLRFGDFYQIHISSKKTRQFSPPYSYAHSSRKLRKLDQSQNCVWVTRWNPAIGLRLFRRMFPTCSGSTVPDETLQFDDQQLSNRVSLTCSQVYEIV